MGGHVPTWVLEDLKQRLAAREDRPGYKRNAQALRAELARLERSDGKTQHG
jgi:hypothetical protein